jgi:tetratricopeptide (TPR) repeat protein
MQKIAVTVSAAGLALLLISSLLSVAVVRAADCEYLKGNIKKERDLNKRRALLRQAVEHCPDDAGLHYSYGYGLERSRKYEEALEQYAKALELDPSMAKAHFNRGDIYKSQENYGEAILAYQKGLELDPDNRRARKSLTEALGAAQNR